MLPRRARQQPVGPFSSHSPSTCTFYFANDTDTDVKTTHTQKIQSTWSNGPTLSGGCLTWRGVNALRDDLIHRFEIIPTATTTTTWYLCVEKLYKTVPFDGLSPTDELQPLSLSLSIYVGVVDRLLPAAAAPPPRAATTSGKNAAN